jgi:hypothetical protein
MEIFGFVKKSPYSSRTRTSFPAEACGYLTTPGIDTDAHVEGWKVIAQAEAALIGHCRGVAGWYSWHHARTGARIGGLHIASKKRARLGEILQPDLFYSRCL